MLEPQKPALRIGRCVSESFSIWTNNLPVFFLATLTMLIVGLPLVLFALVGLFTGLMVLVLDAMEGRPVRIRAIFRPLRHPVRFIFLNGLSLLAVTLFLTLAALLVVVILPPEVLLSPIASSVRSLHDLVSQFVSKDLLAWLPAYQTTENWSIILPLAFLVAALGTEAFVLVLRSIYVPLIAAHRKNPLIDAYVESRNTVTRYGYARHLALILMMLVTLSLLDFVIDSDSLYQISVVMLLPFGIGLVVSAYRQTIGVEEANRVLREQQFVEMRSELQTAHDMQMSLLPDGPPELTGYFLDGLSVPANNVGGDYFAYRWLDEKETRLAIIVADVSGKAMQAAVTALRFNEILRYECRDRTDPGHILGGLTRALDDQVDDATFVTCCIAVLDTATGKVEIANAGHCYPYQVGRRSQLVLPVEINGLPLGIPAVIRPDTPYETITINLQPGDGLVIYSDGVVEAQNAAGEMYEEDRLTEIIQRTLPTDGVTTSVRSIYRYVEKFVQGAPRTDDITVVALKRDISPETFTSS